MAKVTGPLFSFSASGHLGRRSFRRLSGRNIAQATPAANLSPALIGANADRAAMHELWTGAPVSGAMRAAWKYDPRYTDETGLWYQRPFEVFQLQRTVPTLPIALDFSFDSHAILSFTWTSLEVYYGGAPTLQTLALYAGADPLSLSLAQTLDDESPGASVFDGVCLKNLYWQVTVAGEPITPVIVGPSLYAGCLALRDNVRDTFGSTVIQSYLKADQAIPSFAPAAAWSISIWVYATLRPASWSGVFFSLNTDPTGSDALHIGIRGNQIGATDRDKLLFFLQDAPSYSATLSVNKIAYDTWQHAVFVYHGNATCSLWLNGSKERDAVACFSIPGDYPMTPAMVAGDGRGYYTWPGLLDQILVYQRALTDPQVAALWNSGAGAAPPLPDSDLLVYLPFDDDFSDLGPHALSFSLTKTFPDDTVEIEPGKTF